MSQLSRIKARLNRGQTLTAMDAINLYGCYRLSARIFDLRNSGYPVDVVMVKTADGKRFAKYSRGRK